MKRPIYLDYAAATPIDPRVLEAMRPYWQDEFFNPSATYSAALATKKALSQARTLVAHWLGARPAEITFTAGGTEANNLAIHGVMRRFPEANVVVSALEHESVLAPAHDYDCREAKIQPDGRLDMADLRRRIDDKTVLVSVMYANNEIGTIQPVREVAKLVNEIRRQRGIKGLPLYLHTDACQAANYLDLHVSRLGVDMMTVNGGKIYGPKQSGALYVRGGLSLEPLIKGGGQERGLRSGTENVTGSVGFGVALDLAQKSRSEESARLQKLRQRFIERLTGAIPAATVNSSLKSRLPNNVHLTIPGQDNERLLIQLDEAGVLAAAGSACSASDEESSHVLRAIGLSDAEARASLRLTMGRGTTAEAIDQTVRILARLIAG